MCHWFQEKKLWSGSNSNTNMLVAMAALSEINKLADDASVDMTSKKSIGLFNNQLQWEMVQWFSFELVYDFRFIFAPKINSLHT